MKPEKKAKMATDEEFVKAGVRLELVQILRKLNINTIAQMKEQSASKLLNDMGGMRKKLKLQNVTAASSEEIEGWLAMVYYLVSSILKD